MMLETMKQLAAGAEQSLKHCAAVRNQSLAKYGCRCRRLPLLEGDRRRELTGMTYKQMRAGWYRGSVSRALPLA